MASSHNHKPRARDCYGFKGSGREKACALDCCVFEGCAVPVCVPIEPLHEAPSLEHRVRRLCGRRSCAVQGSWGKRG